MNDENIEDMMFVNSLKVIKGDLFLQNVKNIEVLSSVFRLLSQY